MGNFGDVREILQRPPNLKTWESLIDVLDAWYGREPLDVVLSYCKDYLTHWPAELPTFAPNSWFKRDPALIAKNPITAFFEAAFLGRTAHWQQWAIAQLEAQKSLKPPGFLDLDALGPLRWRGGESLDETLRKQLVVYLRSFKEVAPAPLERLRQLLNDEDAQRWSRLIHEAWIAKGSPSSHRWAFFQLATLGNQDQIEFNTDSLTSMISEGRHVRAKQLMEMRAALGTREALSDVANFVVFGPLSMTTRQYGVGLLEPLAKARGLKLEDYIERRLTLQDQVIPASLEYWEDPLSPFVIEELAPAVSEDEGEGDEDARIDLKRPPSTLATWLERAMITQRAFPWWMCRDLIEQLAQQPGLLWSVDGGEVVWMSAQGPANLADELVELKDEDLLRITHPATLKPKLRQQWSAALAKRALTPPFIQLERPTYDKTNLLITPSKPLPAHPYTLFFTTAEWGPGIDNDDNVSELCFHVPGALWCALASPNFIYSYEGGFYMSEAGPSTLTEVGVVSIFDLFNRKSTWARDAVAISETHYALARLVALDAHTVHDDNPFS